MDTDEYRSAYEGRTGADRMILNLAIIPDKLRGDMDEVARLREALKKIRDIDYRGNRHESHFIAERALMSKPAMPELPGEAAVQCSALLAAIVERKKEIMVKRPDPQCYPTMYAYWEGKRDEIERTENMVIGMAANDAKLRDAGESSVE